MSRWLGRFGFAMVAHDLLYWCDSLSGNREDTAVVVAEVGGKLYDCIRNILQCLPRAHSVDEFRRRDTQVVRITLDGEPAELSMACEIEKILQAAPPEGSVLVPAADGRGTNAAWRSPAGLFPLRFGNDSFKPHLAAARATGKPCLVLSLPGIALDIDNPSDLRQLAQAPGETRAQRLIRPWDLTDLAPAANE